MAAARSSSTKAAAGGSAFLLWRSVPLLAAAALVAAQVHGVAAFSTPQPAVGRVFSPFRHRDTSTCLAAAFDRSEEKLDVPTSVSSGSEHAGTEESNSMLSSVVSDIGSAVRSFTVASALFVSVLLGNGSTNSMGPVAVNQAAWAADAPAAAKPAASTTTSTSSPVEASLHIPKLRHQIKSLQKPLLDKEAVLREDQRSVTKNLEKTKRLKIELQRAQDEEKKVKLELEKNDKKKQAAKSTAAPAPAAKSAAPAAKSTSTTSNKPKSKPASLSKTQVKSLQSRLEVATKRITNAKSALSTAETDLKSSQTALEKSTKEVAKIKKELKGARQKLKDAKRVRGAEGRYVFDSLAPLTFGGGLVWWLLNNQNYGRDGYYGEDGYDRDGYYDEYGYDGERGRRGGGGGRMDRRKSQRKQFQTALVILSAIGLTSSISSFNAEGDGLTSTVVPIILGVGVLSWVVVWQQRQRDEYYGIDRRRERYDEYGNRIVGSEDLIDTTATQAAIILFSALGLTAALLSYGSYGNDVSDLLNGSTLLVICAVGVGLWAYNNNDYVDQYDEYGERVYGSGRRFDRGVPFDFDAVFSRMYDSDDDGRANWWEWWKNDPDRFRNGLNRRRQRSDRSYYQDDRVDVIRNDDYYANYELDRRLSGPPRATNGYYGRDVEPRSGGRAGRGEHARRDIDDEGRYYNDGPPRGNPSNYSRQTRDEYFDGGSRYYDDNRYDDRGQAQDLRFREYSDQPPARRSPPPGTASRPSAGGEGNQNRDSNRWGNSLSQWD